MRNTILFLLIVKCSIGFSQYFEEFPLGTWYFDEECSQKSAEIYTADSFDENNNEICFGTIKPEASRDKLPAIDPYALPNELRQYVLLRTSWEFTKKKLICNWGKYEVIGSTPDMELVFLIVNLREKAKNKYDWDYDDQEEVIKIFRKKMPPELSSIEYKVISKNPFIIRRLENSGRK